MKKHRFAGAFFMKKGRMPGVRGLFILVASHSLCVAPSTVRMRRLQLGSVSSRRDIH